MATDSIAQIDEQWKTVVGFDDYEVSNLGNVRSKARVVRFEGRWGVWIDRPLEAREMRTTVSRNYLGVTLRREGVKFYRGVHLLVCEAFHGPKPTETAQAAHNDGNGLNNEISNLRWAEPKDNNADKRLHGTQPFGDNHKMMKIPDAAVLLLRRTDGSEDAAFARKYGMKKYYITQIRRGEFRREVR